MSTEPTHLEDPQMRELVKPWQRMWRVDVPDIGVLACYGAPSCIVHVIDYLEGGWDAYVPPTSSTSVDAKVQALKRFADPPAEAGPCKHPETACFPVRLGRGNMAHRTMGVWCRECGTTRADGEEWPS